MTIYLKYFYKTDEHFFDPATITFCQSTFDQNLGDLRKFFMEDVDVNEVDIEVFVQNEFNKNEDLNEAIRLIMKDIKNQGSCTYWILEGLFDEADIVEKKIAMLRYLLEKFFVSTLSYKLRLDDENYVECVYSYLGPYQFKYCLPRDIAKKYCNHVSEFGANILNLMELSPEELATYVMPLYYHEIGWWDRQFLREDAKIMAKLSSSWVDNSLQGSMRLTNYQLMRLFLFDNHDPFSYDHGELQGIIDEELEKAKEMLAKEAYTDDFCFQLTEEEFDALEINVDFQKALKLIPSYLKCHCAVLEESYKGEAYFSESYPLDTDYVDDMVSAGYEAPSKYIPDLDLGCLLLKMSDSGYEQAQIETFKDKWLECLLEMDSKR